LQLSGIEDISSAVLGRRGVEERDPLRVVARQSTLRYDASTRVQPPLVSCIAFLGGAAPHCACVRQPAPLMTGRER
jgi:hypothetical protein